MIYRSFAEIPADFGPCAITIGNFDGVHLGHREIFRRVIAIARANGWKSSAVTFDPHPTKLVAPAEAPHLLTTPHERARIMGQLGIEEVLIAPFTRDIASLAPEQFVRELLVDKLNARAVVVGDNFRFGHRAAGDVQTLEELGYKYSFETQIVQAVVRRGRIISSTAIRRLIAAGEVSSACRMLGRPYSLEGPVVRGEGRGSKETVPTLNLAPAFDVLPKTGVYITRTREAGSTREWPSLTNVGLRPTFNGHGLTIETYLLSSIHGAPPQAISVEFLRWVREERKFETPEALKNQILRDVGRAQVYFRRLSEMTAPAR